MADLEDLQEILEACVMSGIYDAPLWMEEERERRRRVGEGEPMEGDVDCTVTSDDIKQLARLMRIDSANQSQFDQSVDQMYARCIDTSTVSSFLPASMIPSPTKKTSKTTGTNKKCDANKGHHKGKRHSVAAELVGEINKMGVGTSRSKEEGQRGEVDFPELLCELERMFPDPVDCFDIERAFSVLDENKNGNVSLEEMKEGMGKFARENNLVHYVGGAAASPPSLGAVGGRVGKAKQRRGHVETQEVEELYSFLVSHHTSQVQLQDNSAIVISRRNSNRSLLVKRSTASSFSDLTETVGNELIPCNGTQNVASGGGAGGGGSGTGCAIEDGFTIDAMLSTLEPPPDQRQV